MNSKSHQKDICSYLEGLLKFLDSDYNSKSDLIESFYTIAMPKYVCECKKHVRYWLASQRFYLKRSLRGLAQCDLKPKARDAIWDPAKESFETYAFNFKQEVFRHYTSVSNRRKHTHDNCTYLGGLQRFSKI